MSCVMLPHLLSAGKQQQLQHAEHKADTAECCCVVINAGFHHRIQQCQADASFQCLPSGTKGVTEEAQSQKYLKVFPQKQRVCAALGDKNTKLYLSFLSRFQSFIFLQAEAPLGALPVALDRAGRTNKGGGLYSSSVPASLSWGLR